MERQLQVQRQIARFLENFRKIGRSHHTPASVRSRIRTLKELWLTFIDGHIMLEKTIPESTRASLPYYSDNIHDDTEEMYHSTLDRLAEVLEELEPPLQNRSAELSYSRSSTSAFSLSHLPTIQLPPFDGNVAEWEQFRDRFSAIIIENHDLNDYARMHFLVSFLRGRALECIAGLAIVADNFVVAWKALRDRYDNKRRLLSSHMNAMLTLPRLNRESYNELQALRGQVKMTIASLHNLREAPAELWDDFLVHIVTQSLDPVTRKAWTLRLPDGHEPVSFDKLDDFLATRIRALEDISSTPTSRTRYS